jgi:hypothetical protein
MTTTHSRTTSQPHDANRTEQLNQLSAFTGSMTNAFARATQAYLEALTSLNSEVAGFMSERWRCDMDLGQSLARCGNWSEAAALQQDWVRRAAQDYLSEATKLMQLASNSALDAWNPLIRQATKDAMKSTKPSAKSA